MNEAVTSKFSATQFGQCIRHGDHLIQADVAPAAGGGDTGMNPHALLAAALCACTGMTLWMYAQRKAWPLQDAPCAVQIMHANEQTQIVRKISFVGPLSAAQKDKLLQIANKCPIHLLLCGQIEVTTELLA